MTSSAIAVDVNESQIDQQLIDKHLQKQVQKDEGMASSATTAKLPTSTGEGPCSARVSKIPVFDDLEPVCAFKASAALDKFMLRAHPVPEARNKLSQQFV